MIQHLNLEQLPRASEIAGHADVRYRRGRIARRMPVGREVREGQTVWVLDAYAPLPRVRDRVGGNRPVTK